VFAHQPREFKSIKKNQLPTADMPAALHFDMAA